MSDPAIGDAIFRIGSAWDAGDLTLAAAVAKLRAEVPTLNELGATLQIKAWESARSRYAPAPPAPAVDARRLSPAALRKQPIVIRFG